MNGSAASYPVSPSIPARPVADRTRLLLEAPIVPTLLRLAAPNVLAAIALGFVAYAGLTSIALLRIKMAAQAQGSTT